MDISALNLLTSQVKSDASAGVQSTGQHSQTGGEGGKPFAQMLDGKVVTASVTSANTETNQVKALQPVVQLLDKLQSLQLQINELPEGANLAESVVNLAAFQSLPAPMQHLLQQAMAEGKISTVADMHQLLGAVQNALTEALPPGLQAKLDSYLLGKKNKEFDAVGLGERKSSEEVSGAAEDSAYVLPEALQPLLADILASLQRSLHVSISAKDLLGRGDVEVGEVLAGLKPLDVEAGAKDNLQSPTDITAALLDVQNKDILQEFATDAAALKNAVTHSSSLQESVEISIENQVFMADAMDDAISKQAAISAAAGVIESVEEQAVNDNVLRVPLDQMIRLSPLSAGGSSATSNASEKNKTSSVSLGVNSAVMPNVVLGHVSAQEVVGGKAPTEKSFNDIPLGQTAQQLLGRITIKPHRDQNDYTIQLDPVELGKVEIKLSINKHGEVHLSMMVDNRAALEALQRDARFLEKGMQDAGLKMDASNMNFNLKDDTQQQAASSFADQMNRDGQGRQTPEGKSSAGYNDAQGAAETTLDIILPRRATMADGLDIRV